MKYVVLSVCVLLLACKSELELSIPDEVMIDALYDKHIAQAALNRVPDAVRDSMHAVYHDQILRRYDITTDQWDNAMSYLLDDLAAYVKLQEQVKDRLRSDADK